MLESAQAEFLVLLPAAGKPLPAADHLWLQHGEEGWLSALPNVRHYAYPVHPSGGFLASRTLASSLYLLVARLFSRRYEDAFRLCESCATDAALSAEEQQLWDLLEHATSDVHPTPTRAARLARHGGEDIQACPWSAAAELDAYVLKAAYVSPACALAEEELLLLDQCAPAELLNRRALLAALAEAARDARARAPKQRDCFEAVGDTTHRGRVEVASGAIDTCSASSPPPRTRPGPASGVEAAASCTRR